MAFNVTPSAAQRSRQIKLDAAEAARPNVVEQVTDQVQRHPWLGRLFLAAVATAFALNIVDTGLSIIDRLGWLNWLKIWFWGVQQ